MSESARCELDKGLCRAHHCLWTRTGNQRRTLHADQGFSRRSDCWGGCANGKAHGKGMNTARQIGEYGLLLRPGSCFATFWDAIGSDKWISQKSARRFQITGCMLVMITPTCLQKSVNCGVYNDFSLRGAFGRWTYPHGTRK